MIDARIWRSASTTAPASSISVLSRCPRDFASRRAETSASSSSWRMSMRSDSLDPHFEPHGGQRTIDEVAQGEQTAFEHGTGASDDAEAAGLQHVVGEERGRQEVPQLVREDPEVLDSGGADRGFALARELRHRAGDRLVEAQVERLKLARRDGRGALDRQLGNRLTCVAVVVHDLRDRKPDVHQLATVLRGARSKIRSAIELRVQGPCELLEEERDPVLELDGGRSRRQPSCHPRAASPHDLGAIRGDEFAQHAWTPCKEHAADRVLVTGASYAQNYVRSRCVVDALPSHMHPDLGVKDLLTSSS